MDYLPTLIEASLPLPGKSEVGDYLSRSGTRLPLPGVIEPVWESVLALVAPVVGAPLDTTGKWFDGAIAGGRTIEQVARDGVFEVINQSCRGHRRPPWGSAVVLSRAGSTGVARSTTPRTEKRRSLA